MTFAITMEERHEASLEAIIPDIRSSSISRVLIYKSNDLCYSGNSYNFWNYVSIIKKGSDNIYSINYYEKKRK